MGKQVLVDQTVSYSHTILEIPAMRRRILLIACLLTSVLSFAMESVASEELVGKVIRFSVKFYNAHIYSFYGDYHFTDAHDARLLKDGLPIVDTSRFGT